MENEIEMLKCIYKLGMERKIGIDITTKNIKTGWDGCASFIREDNKIKVFEGNGDGSDDKEMTYEEFINNYKYQIGIIK